MKTLLTLLIASLITITTSTTTQAQEAFEGTIHYNITCQIENNDDFIAFLPKGVEYKFHNKEVLKTQEGGNWSETSGYFYFLIKEDGASYMVKDAEQSAYLFGSDTEAESDDATKPEPTITKEDEVIEISGYECQKYKVVYTGEYEAVVYVWATSELNIVYPENASSQTGPIIIEGIEGFPLKKVSITNVKGSELTITEEANLITQSEMKDSDFQIPTIYKIADFTPAAMYDGTKY